MSFETNMRIKMPYRPKYGWALHPIFANGLTAPVAPLKR
jgi:hypothetical protein